MKRFDFKNLILKSTDPETATGSIVQQLEDEGVYYDFSSNFSEKVINKIFYAAVAVKRETEFLRNLNSAFYRIALTGIAAIVILMISIFMMEGSFSLDSFLGISDNFTESTVLLLTGN
jgi:hypothetical protein